MEWKIPLFKTYNDEEDIKAVSKIITRGTYWASGKEINEFETKLAEFNERKFALTFNSGTTAWYALLKAYKLTNCEIIIPSFTFIATTNPILMSEAKPVFAEVEDQTYGLDANDVNKKITAKTKAIVPVLYGGQPCRDMQALKELAEDKKLLLLEDAAESFGSSLAGIKAGNFGDAAMFSLCQNKVITTGEGGFILTDDKKIYERLKLIRSHGRIESIQGDYFSNINESEYTELGLNFRMTTMQAALGLAQLKKIEKIITMRRKNAHYLTKALEKCRNIFPPIELKNAFHVYQMYSIKTASKEFRDGLQHYLSKNGIMSKVYFHPLHLKTYYQKLLGTKKGDLPNTEALAETILTLPMFPQLTKQELKY
ncbi:MAG: DegT/DnrJ/EryC1/StrS family aminotransferase, partial [Candidatus Gerdarchaeota archaeon]